MKLDIQLTIDIPENWLPDIMEALNKGKREPEIPYQISVNPITNFFNIVYMYDIVINTKDPGIIQRVVNVVNSFTEVKTDV